MTTKLEQLQAKIESQTKKLEELKAQEEKVKQEEAERAKLTEQLAVILPELEEKAQELFVGYGLVFPEGKQIVLTHSDEGFDAGLVDIKPARTKAAGSQPRVGGNGGRKSVVMADGRLVSYTDICAEHGLEVGEDSGRRVLAKAARKDDALKDMLKATMSPEAYATLGI